MMFLELSKEEALVMSDWIYKNSGNENYFDDDAVKCIFWSIESLLERELVEPFSENYEELVAKAKEIVKKNYGI